ncbi:MAG: Crp/Fnr family transcriptional regulator [Gallionellaceae bacterium]|nr:Crp/Fnr family transcriptional regulator [Gallionellaceae bacterium]
MSVYPMIIPENRLLADMPAHDRESFMAQCARVELQLGSVICQPGEPIRYVYFPIDSFISLVKPVDEHANLEVALVGNEGMLGISLILGVEISQLQFLVQGAGWAWRMESGAFRRIYLQYPALQTELKRYLHVLMSQFAQTAACTRFHVVEARLARWLLMTQDRAHSDAFHVTHEFLAYMLGVRRVGVTKAAGSLQKRTLIQYSRGDIKILNRGGLEAAACGCYQADKETYESLLGYSR